jgi:hypothetical protein
LSFLAHTITEQRKHFVPISFHSTATAHRTHEPRRQNNNLQPSETNNVHTKQLENFLSNQLNKTSTFAWLFTNKNEISLFF